MDDGEFQLGVDEARADIKAGAMRYFFQSRGSWGEKLTELMRDRFSIQVIHVSDITRDAKKSYEQGYNTTIESYLNEKFGPDAFGSTWAEVKAFRQADYQRWLASRGSA